MGVPSLLYERLGAIIRKHRRRLGLTQEHLSSQLGISRAALSNVETGRQRVLVHQLYSLAEQLDIKVSALLPASEENKTFRVLGWPTIFRECESGTGATNCSPITAPIGNRRSTCSVTTQ